MNKSDNHVLCQVTSQIWQLLQHGMAGRQGQWEYKNYTLSFPKEVGKSCVLFYHVFSDISPCTTIVSDIENYPSASMFCCSDNLAQLLPCTFEIWGLKTYQSKNKLLTGDMLINWSEAVNLRDAVAHVHRTSSAPDLFNYIDRPVEYLLQLKYCISLNDCQHETQAEPLAHVFCVHIAMCSYMYHKDVSLGSEH